MADVERSVRIAFEGDDQISPVIDTINGKITGFASSVQGVTGPLADMAAAVLKTEAALTALATGAIVLAVAEAGKFESQFKEITTLFDASPENVEKFRVALLNFASSSLTPLEQVGKATYEAISAGIDWTKAIDFMTVAEKLNVAGKGELQATTLALAGAINAYGGDVSKAADFSDTLFQAVKVGNITLPDLAAGLGNVASMAATAGIPFSDLNAAIAAMTSYGVPAAEAMTQVRQAIVSILAPSDEAKKTAEALGIQFDAEALKANGLQGVLQLIYEKTGGNVAQMKELIPRIEGLNAALVLGQDSGGKFADALFQMETRAGATAGAYDKMATSFENVNNKILNTLKSTLIEVGTPLLDEYAAIGAGITSIFSNLKVEVNEGTFDPLLNLVQEFGAQLAIDLKKIAEVMPEALAGVDWTELTDSIKSVGESIKGLFAAAFGDVDLTTAEGLQSAIQKIVDGVSALTNVTAGILQSWTPFIEGLAKAAEEFTKMSPEAQKTAGGVLGFGQAIDKILNQVDIFTGALKFLGGAFVLLGASQIPATITGLTALVPMIASAVGALGPFGAVVTAIGTSWVLDKVLSLTVPEWDKHRDAVNENVLALHDGSDMLDGLTSSAEEAVPKISATAQSVAGLTESLKEMPAEKSVQIEATGAALTKSEIDEIVEAFAAVGDKKEISITAKTDTAEVGNEIAKVGDIVLTEFPDGVIILTQTKPDTASITSTKDAINKDLPPQKIMEIMIQGDIDVQLASIKATADVVQKSLEWEAKVDIAEIEAMAKTLQELSKNTADMFASAGDTIVGLSSALKGVNAPDILELMQAEQAIQQALAESQISMNTAQIEYMKAKTLALSQGQGMITISADGLQVELEMVLQKIIQLTQIKANEEGLAFLLGV